MQVGMFSAFANLPTWAIWATALLLVIPAAIALTGALIWYVGERKGLALAIWGGVYVIWMLIPLRITGELRHLATFISVFGFVWLIGSWARRVTWHEPKLALAHVLVAALILALVGVVGFGLLASAPAPALAAP
jgi:hypothetical protein